jgi:hypothetical protein
LEHEKEIKIQLLFAPWNTALCTSVGTLAYSPYFNDDLISASVKCDFLDFFIPQVFHESA